MEGTKPSADWPFRSLLQRYRIAAGLSRDDLEERAGLGVNTVKSIEIGRRLHTRPDTKKRLADALNLSSNDRAIFDAAYYRERQGPVAAQTPTTSNDLPRSPTPFIGREHDVAALTVQLQQRDTRVITLTGTSGIGKTRLALEVAWELRSVFEDGVHFVGLADKDPLLLVAQVAAQFGVVKQADQPLQGTLIAALRSRRALLLLDSCEYMIEPCRELISAICDTCPEMRILATSQEQLQLHAEQHYPVHPLPYALSATKPTAEMASELGSVRLFVARTQVREPNFALSDANVTSILNICRQLDGMPLAIELAAAWGHVLTPEVISQKLQARFKLLTHGSKDAPTRHQTLRAAIDWSWHLLDPQEAALLRQLSVFRGDWSLEAAEVICTSDGVEEHMVLDLLYALVAKSLVVRITYGTEARFRLLESIRAYADERLAQEGDRTVARRHLDYFLVLAEEADRAGPEAQLHWLEVLKNDHDNLQAALTCAAELHQMDEACRFVLAMAWFWQMHNHVAEGYQWFTKILGRPEGVSHIQRAALLNRSAWFAQIDGVDSAVARESYQAALTLYRDMGNRLGEAGSLHGLGRVALKRSSSGGIQFCQDARQYFQAALTLYRDIGNRLGQANALHGLGRVNEMNYSQQILHDEQQRLERQEKLRGLGPVNEMDDRRQRLERQAKKKNQCYQKARRCYQKALTLYRALGARLGQANALSGLGRVAEGQDNHEEAYQSYQGALALYRVLGNRLGQGDALEALGRVAREQNDYEEAYQYYGEALAIYREMGATGGLMSTLGGLGTVALYAGNREEMNRYFDEMGAIHSDLRARIRDRTSESGTLTAQDWLYAMPDLDEKLNEID